MFDYFDMYTTWARMRLDFSDAKYAPSRSMVIKNKIRRARQRLVKRR
jgi:hypothetical protein